MGTSEPIPWECQPAMPTGKSKTWGIETLSFPIGTDSSIRVGSVNAMPNGDNRDVST